MLIKIGHKFYPIKLKTSIQNFSLKFNKFSPLQRSLISALAALLSYGAWGYLVNSMHGTHAAFKAASVQGIYSFVLTMLMTFLIEIIYSLVSRYISSRALISAITIVINCILVFSASWWINYIAGIPEIFNTVILGYIFGGIFTVIYVTGLSKDESFLKRSL